MKMEGIFGYAVKDHYPLREPYGDSYIIFLLLALSLLFFLPRLLQSLGRLVRLPLNCLAFSALFGMFCCSREPKWLPISVNIDDIAISRGPTDSIVEKHFVSMENVDTCSIEFRNRAPNPKDEFHE
jgi:hypothetical protein